MFTKKDLQNGDVVEYKNGSRRVVIDDQLFGEDGYSKLDAFSGNLKASHYTIMKVYRNPKCFSNCDESNCIYDRNTDDVKEMTLAEVCKELGYNIKIVRGENE